ncbi:MAG TPA: hypothetical protein VHH36_08930 [Candidatus Thermoplasmatota archaeon]|nr:hypothetical protein [Candidatus Thermoplasmatota archaeon]
MSKKQSLLVACALIALAVPALAPGASARLGVCSESRTTDGNATTSTSDCLVAVSGTDLVGQDYVCVSYHQSDSDDGRGRVKHEETCGTALL